MVEGDSEGPSNGDSKEPGVGGAWELPLAFCILFLFICCCLHSRGGQGKHPPSLVPRSTEGRGAEEVGTSPPPSPSPFFPFPILGPCIIVSE